VPTDVAASNATDVAAPNATVRLGVATSVGDAEDSEMPLQRPLGVATSVGERDWVTLQRPLGIATSVGDNEVPLAGKL
jgi:hypothetical protein